MPPETIYQKYFELDQNVTATAAFFGISEAEVVDAVETRAKQNEIEECFEVYLSFLKENQRHGTVAALRRYGLSNKWRKVYATFKEFVEAAREYAPDRFREYIFDAQMIFEDPARRARVEEVVQNKKRLVFTTAVSEKPVHANFYAALKNYCERMDAALIILPSRDSWSKQAANPGSDKSLWTIDPALVDEVFVTGDMEITPILNVLGIGISAKQINPLTGINRVMGDKHNVIVPSPKQDLQYEATGHLMPALAGMSTGAITCIDYNTDRYAACRLSYLAEHDHVFGAIVVEIEDDDLFHFRQIQMADYIGGSFCDMGRRYHADGSVEDVETHLICGDWHTGFTDSAVRPAIEKLCYNLNISTIVLHDFFDGYSISHHDIKNPVKMAIKHKRGFGDLEEELKKCSAEIEWFKGLTDGMIVMVKSNHDEVLHRYVEECNFVRDPSNMNIGADLLKYMINGEDRDVDQDPRDRDVLVKALEAVGKSDPAWDRVRWLKRTDNFKIGGVELGMHGDKGKHGSRGSPRQFQTIGEGGVIMGHTHTAYINKRVWYVGTSSRLDPDYASDGSLSAWTHTSALLYNDGTRQLINFFDGKWTTMNMKEPTGRLNT